MKLGFHPTVQRDFNAAIRFLAKPARRLQIGSKQKHGLDS